MSLTHSHFALRTTHRLGHAEVGQQRVPPGEQDVPGLDVPVHDPRETNL